MPEVVLVYDRGCPSVKGARTNLMRAFSMAGLPAAWREVDRDGDDVPSAWKRLGSPTILVDGVDVAPAPASEGASCRLYVTDGGLTGAPPVERIVAALRGAKAPAPLVPGRPAFGPFVAALPGVGVAMLPKLACPACWPAYAGLLSSFGIGFLVEVRYLLPLTAVFLVLAVGALAWRAPRRRGFGPAALGLVAGLLLLVGKFVLELEPATWVAVAALVAASVWNSWPKARVAGSCPACVTDGAQPVGGV